MKSACDCAMPEYDCADCPKRVPDEEMVLVGTSNGAPGYSVMCNYERYSANGAEAEARLLAGAEIRAGLACKRRCEELTNTANGGTRND